MNRREMREQIFKMLFRVEFHDESEIPEQFELSMVESVNASKEKQKYIEDKCEDIVAKLAEIDGIINQAAQGWKTTRMAKVDLTLIRLATYEIKFEEDIPTGVAINEAVELAKQYSDEKVKNMINGVMDNILHNK